MKAITVSVTSDISSNSKIWKPEPLAISKKRESKNETKYMKLFDNSLHFYSHDVIRTLQLKNFFVNLHLENPGSWVPCASDFSQPVLWKFHSRLYCCTKIFGSCVWAGLFHPHLLALHDCYIHEVNKNLALSWTFTYVFALYCARA